MLKSSVLSRRRIVGVTTVLAVGAAVVVFGAARLPSTALTPSAATTAVKAAGPAAQPVSPPVATAQAFLAKGGAPALQHELKRSLAKKAFPAKLTPRIQQSPAAEVKYLLPGAQCIQADNIYGTHQCNFGPSNAPKLAVVIGDSISISYLPGLIRALVPEGYRIHGMALAGCPVADVEMNLSYDPDASAKCNQGHQQLYLQVQRLHPDLVIMANSASDIMRMSSGNRGAAAVTEWEKGYNTALLAMDAPGRQFVQISANPTGPDPGTCVKKPNGSLAPPHRCQGFVQAWYQWMKTAESADLAKYDGTYVDARGWYCYDGLCPDFAMGLSMRWDGSHITQQYSEALTPLLKQAVDAATGYTGS